MKKVIKVRDKENQEVKELQNQNQELNKNVKVILGDPYQIKTKSKWLKFRKNFKILLLTANLK